MTNDLSNLFPPALPCVTIEKRTGIDGWWRWRVYILREGEDPRAEGFTDFTDYTEHHDALAAAGEIASRLNLPIADLSEDDW